MNPAIYAYIFYGSLVIMPVLLLLIFLMLDRCRVWSKKTARGVAEVKSEVQQTVKQCLEENYEKSIRDFDLLETANESNAQSEKQETIQFSPDDFFIPPSNSNRELLEIQEIEAAFEEAFKEESIEDKVRDISSEYVADYSDKYLKRPDICLNNIGVKRISIPPELWQTIHSLAYANASGSQNIEPLSISAVAYNIINEHFKTHSDEINILAERGSEKILRGYDRY